MTLRLFMDVHVPRSVTDALRGRGVDVLTAQEDGSAMLTDPDLLDRSTVLARVLVSQDADLVAEARQRIAQEQSFAGVLYTHQLRMTIGQLIDELGTIALAGEPEDLKDRIEFLPLRG